MLSQQSSGAPRTAFWRTTEFRALVYQGIAIAAVLSTAVWIARNTIHNLEQRGIASGFDFLFPPTEAGFPIAEVTPIPALQGGFLYFLVAVGLGWIGAVAVARWARSQGRPLGENPALATAVVVGVFTLPTLVLYFTGDSIATVTFDASQPYFIAMLTGIFNTLKVSAVGCVLATILGLIVGIARLSSNWLVAKLAATYVEVFRNVPLLLQMLFWYFGVLATLPSVRGSIVVWDFMILNNRGIYLPQPVPQPFAAEFMLAVFASIMLIFAYSRYAKARQDRTGEQLPVFYPALAILVALPGLVWLAKGYPFELSYPELQGFNYQGGITLTPEFTAVLLALVIYTASFIAEIVRSGIQSVSKGQREAAFAVGLRSNLVMRLVVLPQALRVIVPPQTSQYLNLTKNSSLAVAIGYPDVVSIGGTILNQSGQAIEIVLIWMMVYLTFSLLISVFMNWYNTRVKLVER